MDPKPMAVIQQLYYRLCVEQLPHYTTADHTTKKGQKSRSGYANLRNIHSRRDDALAAVLKQQVASNNAYPRLKPEDVLQVLQWLFTEIMIFPEPADRARYQNLAPIDRPRYLNRLQCVNAQPIAAGSRNTKHRPYDMLAAIFLCADFMPQTDDQSNRFFAYKYRFKQMYLEQSTHFDYLHKDVFD